MFSFFDNIFRLYNELPTRFVIEPSLLIINKLHKQIYTNSGKECHFEPFCHNITFISY